MNRVEDKTFMFTGRLSITRSKAQDLVREVGGNAGSSLTKSTDYLVVGEDPGSKLTRAGIMGIPELDEEEFFSMLEEARKDQPDYEEPLTPEENRVLDALVVKCKCINCGLEYGSWAEENLCPLCESNPGWNKKDSIPEPDFPSEEYLSYRNLTRLQELIEERPDITVYPGTVCPICDEAIYYSMLGPADWYCFNCHFYIGKSEERQVLSVKVGRSEKVIEKGWNQSVVWDVGDLYLLTKELLVLGYPISEVDMGDIEMHDGKYFTNERGKLLFVGNAELVRNRKIYRIRNYCNSFESSVEASDFLKSLPDDPASILDTLGPYEVDRKLEAFERLYKRRHG